MSQLDFRLNLMALLFLVHQGAQVKRGYSLLNKANYIVNLKGRLFAKHKQAPFLKLWRAMPIT
jgi:hypothetical protein